MLFTWNLKFWPFYIPRNHIIKNGIFVLFGKLSKTKVDVHALQRSRLEIHAFSRSWEIVWTKSLHIRPNPYTVTVTMHCSTSCHSFNWSLKTGMAQHNPVLSQLPLHWLKPWLKRKPHRSSGNHDWLLANASACVSCGFRLRNARNASDCVWMETGLERETSSNAPTTLDWMMFLLTCDKKLTKSHSTTIPVYQTNSDYLTENHGKGGISEHQFWWQITQQSSK